MKKHSMFRKNVNSRFLWRLRGFSLIELLISITIIATLIGLALPNFLGARSRAKDSRKKGEIRQLKTALQLYYNDYKLFPGDASPSPFFNVIKGCGADGTVSCPVSGCSVQFGAGGSSACDIANMSVYMTKLPEEFGSSMFYYRKNSGADFCLKVALENKSDSDIAKSWAQCAAKCSGLGNTDYAVCSE